VLTEAMSRHWIDDPAVVRRAELQRAQDAGGQAHTMEAEPFAPGLARQLLEREVAVNDRLRALESDVRRLEREVADNEAEGPRHLEAIAHAEKIIGDASSRLEEYDRAFKRRHHEREIDWARTQIRNSELKIQDSRIAIAKAEARAPGLEQELDRARVALGESPALQAERHDIRQRLGADLAARAEELRRDPPDHIVDELGGRPPRGKAAAIWDEAAARIDQHRSVFAITDTRELLGLHRSNDRAFEASREAALKASQRMDRVIGRDLGVQPPTRVMELSR
jgi:chromosome segregation ATPase